MAVASFVIIVSTGGVNRLYWDTISNIAIRGVCNFGCYIVIFSIVIEVLSHYFPYNGRYLFIRLFISAMIGLSIAYLSANINALFPFPAAMTAAQDDFLFIFIITFFQCGMIFTTLEIWEMIKRNRNLNVTLTQMEKEKITSQLQALRQQINPHFLFNSLNVLSELIHEDIEKSDLFIQHFARVYRYVLQINQETVVTLLQELAFLDSYIFLQKIRFGENLQVEIGVAKAALQQYVPPLSLQVLFENAIKHNTISTAGPLRIELKSEGDILKIVNTLQRHNTPPNGTGVGQVNLKNKYELISEQSPDFYIANGRYIAELPLIRISPWRELSWLKTST